MSHRLTAQSSGTTDGLADAPIAIDLRVARKSRQPGVSGLTISARAFAMIRRTLVSAGVESTNGDEPGVKLKRLVARPSGQALARLSITSP